MICSFLDTKAIVFLTIGSEFKLGRVISLYCVYAWGRTGHTYLESIDRLYDIVEQS